MTEEREKRGMFIAGSGQRIVSPDDLTESRPDLVLVMNPNYRDEIRRTIDDLGLAIELVTV